MCLKRNLGSVSSNAIVVPETKTHSVVVEPTPVPKKLDYWICDTCTLHNSLEYTTCEVCCTVRAGAYSGTSSEFKVPSSQFNRPNFEYENYNVKQHSPSTTSTVTSTHRNYKYINQQSSHLREKELPQAKLLSTYQHDTVLKPIIFDSPFNRLYHLLYSTQSQYSMGAVSACTTMAVQAALTLLKDTSGHVKPFGCTSEMIDGILMKGSKYKNVSHQDIFDVMKANHELNENLHHVCINLFACLK